ncbi:Sulfate-binding protein precursor [compost metagenome]
MVKKNAEKHGTSEAAKAYLDYLYTEEGQTLAAKHYYRPRLASVAEKFKDQFATLETFDISSFGGWREAQKKHFSDDGIFDQIYQPK